MTKLKIYNDVQSTKIEVETAFPLEISELLNEYGIVYKKIDLPDALSRSSNDEDLFKGVKEMLKPDLQRNNLKHCSVVSLDETNQNVERTKMKYLSEYKLEKNEAYLTIEGTYLLSLHFDEKVIQLNCDRGDFVTVPADINRWMDIGPTGHFSAVRCEESTEAPTVIYSGNNIADKFPRLS